MLSRVCFDVYPYLEETHKSISLPLPGLSGSALFTFMHLALIQHAIIASLSEVFVVDKRLELSN